ncbi:DUF805 domain-containing protein [Sphingomicrobium flavum]|uniref:DUF805 domain-containing protein n=1 Tax=Sphingomicrobium flavum TaxID=1229164 RepID=UPI0021AD88BA|nr:DUF805 domain-containing protein [Sphingomicrobium flavum]
MIQTLWGNWMDGRLDQKAFTLAYGVTLLAIVAMVVALGLAAGIVHAFFGSWIDHFEAGQGRGWAIAGVVGLVLALLAIGLAQLNLVMKRARDIGVPAWVAGLVHLILVSTGGALILAIVMMFVPTGQFGAKSSVD